MKIKWITVKFLKKIGACQSEIYLFESKYGSKRVKLSTVVATCLDSGKAELLDYASWLLPRCMSYREYVSYAVYAAEQVIKIYEDKYPADNRPRNAIIAAKKCLQNPSKRNKASAGAAGAAAYNAYASAASAADAAYDAYAASASASASASARAAASAAAAAYAAYADAYAADAYAHRIETKKRIIQYGLFLIGGR